MDRRKFLGASIGGAIIGPSTMKKALAEKIALKQQASLGVNMIAPVALDRVENSSGENPWFYKDLIRNHLYEKQETQLSDPYNHMKSWSECFKQSQRIKDRRKLRLLLRKIDCMESMSDIKAFAKYLGITEEET